MPLKPGDPNKVNVTECLDCGAIFDGEQYQTCPGCESENIKGGLNIAKYYADLLVDSEKQGMETRYYLAAMARGQVYERRKGQDHATG